MNKSIRIKQPTIKAMALVKRGANKVNYSILKNEKGVSGKIFKEESLEELEIRENFVDLNDIKTSAIILDELADIYQDCKEDSTRLKIEELLETYNDKLPEIEDSKKVINMTAEEFLKG